MQRQLRFTDEADRQLRELETNPAKKSLLKQVQKTLGFLEINVRHPGLNTHEYESLPGANGSGSGKLTHKIKPRGPTGSFFTTGLTR